MKKELFMSAEARREVLREYGKKYDLKVFIETGTSVGDTPWALLNDFDVLYTIELDKATFREARKRFRYEPKIHTLQGDSAEILPYVLEEIEGWALIWLDGHYCGEGTGHGKLWTPVTEEILACLDVEGGEHVILIDDARIFKGQPEHEMYEHYSDYPSCEWVQEMAEDYGYEYELKDDIMRLVPYAPK